MQGIILAAGAGKRLGKLTQGIPKPMLKIGNMPILEYTLRLFKKFGIKDVFINLHYKPECIREYFGDGRKFGVDIRYSWEKSLLGTAGAVKKMQPWLRGTFIVAYGDTLRDIDIAAMLKAHKKSKADITIAVYRAGDSRDCGIVKFDKSGLVSEFIEKPEQGLDISDEFANCGVYLINRQLLKFIPVGKSCDFSSDVFPKLLKNGYRVFAFLTKAYLLDIGTPESYAKAKKVFGIFENTLCIRH